MLRHATPHYAAQPYRHLAAATTAAGHDRDTRSILMAQRRDQARGNGVDRRERAWIRFTGATMGYGYRPWYALLWLTAGIVAALMLTLWVPGTSAVSPTSAPPQATNPTNKAAQSVTGDVSQQCSVTERVDLAISYSIPAVVWARGNVECAPNTTTGGKVISWSRYPLTMWSWAFASLFIAGFTGAVRKN